MQRTAARAVEEVKSLLHISLGLRHGTTVSSRVAGSTARRGRKGGAAGRVGRTVILSWGQMRKSTTGLV